ncbi:hypothetical protein NC99_13450 [Sunxiuqinia dokdonensis]|uniref:Uncharacterized protein n=1 Tax=Sunxiuqinia dokdonensis TaxID=1409788 RepID=A0A0L8VBL4_9BACT|nr:hypothetical protein NC99_13450 [Sunxiuqinia dokdonensis]
MKQIKKSNIEMMLLLTYSQSTCWILIVDKSEKYSFKFSIN